jgi:hypothetical protein
VRPLCALLLLLLPAAAAADALLNRPAAAATPRCMYCKQSVNIMQHIVQNDNAMMSISAVK